MQGWGSKAVLQLGDAWPAIDFHTQEPPGRASANPGKGTLLSDVRTVPFSRDAQSPLAV